MALRHLQNLLMVRIAFIHLAVRGEWLKWMVKWLVWAIKEKSAKKSLAVWHGSSRHCTKGELIT